MISESMNKWVLLVIVFFITALFLAMIRQFLMALLMAGIFSALARPVYWGFVRWYRGRRALASITTLVLILCLILLPLIGLLGIVAAQAIDVGQAVTPWVKHQLSTPSSLANLTQHIPFYHLIEPYHETILSKAGELVGTVSRFLYTSLSKATLGTVNFLFMLFILLYCMFFFLMDGEKLLTRILYYLPLEDQPEQKLLAKFTSVTRATLKGTAVIGILQGGLAGIAFAVVGINSAVFWGTVMAVLSIIPSIGTGLVWIPATIILAVSGHYVKAAGLGLFCGLVVGSIDNLLRPKLVGKDTEMHDLLILLSTLGGIAMFGVLGIIIGPVIAALFVTVWEVYGLTFSSVLPQVRYDTNGSGSKDSQEHLANHPPQNKGHDTPRNSP